MSPMFDIEIEHQCYCAENGMFCQFMDKRSGYCLATSCKRMTDLLEQALIERQAELELEKVDGIIYLKEMKENDLERSRSHLQHSSEKTRRR